MKNTLSKLLGYFLKGLLVFTPIAITIFALVWVIMLIDKYLTIPISEDFSIHGGGLIIIIVVLPIIGFLVSNFLGKKLFDWFESLITKIPLIKLLYNSIKDMISAFAGEKKSFNKPVLVSFTKDNSAKILGFITRESMDFLGINDHVAVYMPQSYNFAGNVLIFPKENVTPITADPAEVMAFIVSAGVSGVK